MVKSVLLVGKKHFFNVLSLSSIFLAWKVYFRQLRHSNSNFTKFYDKPESILKTGKRFSTGHSSIISLQCDRGLMVNNHFFLNFFSTVWLDGRTGETVEKLIDKTPSKSKDAFQVSFFDFLYFFSRSP